MHIINDWAAYFRRAIKGFSPRYRARVTSAFLLPSLKYEAIKVFFLRMHLKQIYSISFLNKYKEIMK